MRFTVEPWAPDYGTPIGGDPQEASVVPDVDVEVPAAAWAPIRPRGGEVDEILFVDGVRRVDANLWIETPDGSAELGLCATYAAGAVRCRGGSADVVAAEVRRGLFTSAPGAEAVGAGSVAYEVRATGGATAEELWLGIQQRMGELEGVVAAEHASGALVVVDGPLSHRRHVPGAVGYVKTQHVHYLPPALRPILTALRPGERTPLFLTTTSWSRYSWYLRLADAGGPAGGIVRCEIAGDAAPAVASELADRVSSVLPRYASEGHKDPRAPQNLYPIGGLERALRRRLGDQHLLYRRLRAAAGGSSLPA